MPRYRESSYSGLFRCCRCGKWKKASAFSRRSDTGAPLSHCRACRAEQERERLTDPAEKEKQRQRMRDYRRRRREALTVVVSP